MIIFPFANGRWPQVAALAGPAGVSTVPDQFETGDWSVADDGTSGDITITISALPSDGGSAIIDLEYQIDGGSWVSLGDTTTGDYPVSGLTDDVEVDVAIRAVNAIGNGTASATKPVTPTTGTLEFEYKSSHTITANMQNGQDEDVAGVDFGAANVTRVIILGVQTTDDLSGGTNSIPASITIGGITATAYATVGGTTAYAAIYVAAVPTGTSGTITVTSVNPGTITGTRLTVWRAAHLASNVPHDTYASGTSPGGNGTIDIPAGGFAVGVFRTHNTSDIVWTGLDEESGAEATVETRRYGSASREFVSIATGHTAGATASGNTRARLSIASFR